MKKIFTIFMITLGLFAFSQQVLIQDFTSAATYGSVADFGGSSVAIAADPAAGARGDGFQVTSTAGGEVWQGAEFVLTTKKSKLTTDKTMKIDVFSTVAFTVLGKVENGGPVSATSASYTTPGSWQTLTLNFANAYDGTAPANGEYTKIIFFGNWKADNSGFNSPPADFVFHVDNITSEEAVIVPVPVPMVDAPTPPGRPAADVVSIFSGPYANIAVNEWGPDWGPSSSRINNFTPNLDPAKVIDISAGKTFAGIDFSGSKFDASTFLTFHMDYWIPCPLNAGQTLSIKLSNHDGPGETNAMEVTPTPECGSWQSLDIPLSSFAYAGGAPGMSMANIAQIVITAARADGSLPVPVYIDNIYFHKNTLGVDDINKNKASVSFYPNPVKDQLFVKSAAKVSSLEIYNVNGSLVKNVKNVSENAVNVSDLSKGIYMVKVLFEDKTSTSQKIVK